VYFRFAVFVVSGDVFYTLSFYLMTLRTMSHSGWRERVVIDIKKKITNQLLLFLKPFGKTVITRMTE
jgi:hypothetical protein